MRYLLPRAARSIRKAACGVLALALGLLPALITFAHAGAPVARNVQFAHVTSIDGLSQEFVQAVVQDARGHLWFGTQEGLNRYDGHEVVTYRHAKDDPRSISSDFIWALLVDRDGTLWVATERGLNRYEAEADDFVQPFADFGGADPLGSPRVRALMRDRSGVFWLGTVDQGLIAVDPRTRSLQRWSTLARRGAARSATDLPTGAITTVIEDGTGSIWAGIDGGGVVRLAANRSMTRFRHQPGVPSSLADDRVRALHQDHGGRIWVGTAGGTLNLFDALTGSFQQVPVSIPAPAATGTAGGAGELQPTRKGVGQISALLSDRARTLWLATEAGLCELRQDARNVTCYRRDATDATSLVNDNVNALFEDRSGVLWAGTQGGISRWNRVSETFTYFRAATGALNSDTVTSVDEASDGALWVGTYGGGLTRIHPGTGEVRHYRNQRGDVLQLSTVRIVVPRRPAVDGAGA